MVKIISMALIVIVFSLIAMINDLFGDKDTTLLYWISMNPDHVYDEFLK